MWDNVEGMFEVVSMLRRGVSCAKGFGKINESQHNNYGLNIQK